MSTETPAPLAYDRKRLLLACCVAMTATAMTFSIRGDTLKSFALDFNLTHQQLGYISFMGMFGFPIAILLVGPLCDTIGMGKLLRFAAVGHLSAVVLTLICPMMGPAGFPVLLLANLIFSMANGTIEAVANPLVATMYKDEKSAKLNLLHAFWPMGMIVGGLFCVAVSKAMSIAPDPVAGPATSLSWKIKWAVVIICAVWYLLLTIGQTFPQTERVEQGVSNKEMLQAVMAPGFLVLMFCMCLTAVTELGPDQWVGSVMSDTVKIQGIMGLVYAAGLMFVLRVYAGAFIHKLKPIGMLQIAAVISAIGLFLLSYAFTPVPALVALTVYGIGKCFFWPTMLGMANERFPRTGALGLALMGAAGMFAASAAGPIMGRIYDNGEVASLRASAPQFVNGDKIDGAKVEAALKAGPTSPDAIAISNAKRDGAALSFRKVAVLPGIALLVLLGIGATIKKEGGYQAAGVHD